MSVSEAHNGSRESYFVMALLLALFFGHARGACFRRVSNSGGSGGCGISLFWEMDGTLVRLSVGVGIGVMKGIAGQSAAFSFVMIVSWICGIAWSRMD